MLAVGKHSSQSMTPANASPLRDVPYANHSTSEIQAMSQSANDSSINYERLPEGMAMDETDINLRSYFSRMSDEKLSEYNPRWTDEEVIAWDQENFKDDGTLFLICSERDIEVEEYRRVLEEHIRFRFAKK